ncbi:MAG: DUF4013 domain-containing protein [Chloroflexi bacterium OHK40]
MSELRLRATIATVHRDPQWWLKCLGYGAAAATGLGLPLAAGFVMESLDNTRRGYPTPLPPWGDPWLRSLTGLFCLLIDFAFFVLPLLLGGMGVFCASIVLVIASPTGSATVNVALGVILTLVGLVIAALFIAGASPAGRLIFAREGKIEDAISLAALRLTTSGPGRGAFLRARLASLPAYIPATAAAAVTFGLARTSFPGQMIAIAVGIWLTLAALVYAHLIVVQLYVAAERMAH